MKHYLKNTLTLAITICICIIPIAYAQSADKIPFPEEATLEEIQAIIEHNGYSFTVSHNQIFDMSPEEKATFFSRRAAVQPKYVNPGMGPLKEIVGIRRQPAEFDWRDFNGHSYIGPIRDQGGCGSCYAFGAAAAAEGTYNYAMGLYDANCADFSEAYIAFCLDAYYSGFSGCSGSDYDYDELTALTEYGIIDEVHFPYTDHEQPCGAPDPPPSPVVFESWHRVPCGDIDAIKTAIMTYGVVDAAVMVSAAFEAYQSGIYEDTNTSCTANPCYYQPTNHIISLVGWDDNPPEGGGGVWILRNSWGAENWGENGYMRIRYTSAAVACEVCYMVYDTHPSCPSLYYWDGEQYRRKGFILGGAIPSENEYVDNVVLKGEALVAKDGKYWLQIRETEPEQSFIDSLRILVVPAEDKKILEAASVSDQETCLPPGGYLDRKEAQIGSETNDTRIPLDLVVAFHSKIGNVMHKVNGPPDRNYLRLNTGDVLTLGFSVSNDQEIDFIFSVKGYYEALY